MTKLMKLTVIVAFVTGVAIAVWVLPMLGPWMLPTVLLMVAAYCVYLIWYLLTMPAGPSRED